MTEWFIKGNKADINKISKEHNISKVLATLLANRGLVNREEIQLFLEPIVENMHKPELMKDMIIAGDIIQDCIASGKKIRIIGDYDVDGISSVYILLTALKRVGALVDYAIPDRVQDGYGINQFQVLEAKAHGIDTIITVDNGISANAQIKMGIDMGMRLVVTDHHDTPYILPEASAIINPKQADCRYPDKRICGAGVALKFAQHILSRFGLESELDGLLEVAAIATICDVVDLIGENRIIVVNGLEILNKTTNIGLNALIEESNLGGRPLGAYHVGYVIGPSLNASGRLESALIGLKLLLSDNTEEARSIAARLRELNEERKALTEEGFVKVMRLVDGGLNRNNVIVAYEPSIHESVAGIVAGRIKEKYNKPTIVLTKGNDGIKGSGRSIEGYNIFEELNKCSDLISKYGGHPMAAGLSLTEQNIDLLRDKLNLNSSLTRDELTPKTYIDMPLDPAVVDVFLISDIQKLEPHGKGNSKPTFGFKRLKIQKISILGKNRNALKVIMGNKSGTSFEGIMFNDIEQWIADVKNLYGQLELEKALNGIPNSIEMDIAYYPSVNEYMGRSSVQFVISNYRL